MLRALQKMGARSMRRGGGSGGRAADDGICHRTGMTPARPDVESPGGTSNIVVSAVCTYNDECASKLMGRKNVGINATKLTTGL